jgi:hypothetical protein
VLGLRMFAGFGSMEKYRWSNLSRFKDFQCFKVIIIWL